MYVPLLLFLQCRFIIPYLNHKLQKVSQLSLNLLLFPACLSVNITEPVPLYSPTQQLLYILLPSSPRYCWSVPYVLILQLQQICLCFKILSCLHIISFPLSLLYFIWSNNYYNSTYILFLSFQFALLFYMVDMATGFSSQEGKVSILDKVIN